MAVPDPSNLPSEFKELERRLAELKSQYQRGQMSEQVYQTAVQALTIRDSSGSSFSERAAASLRYERALPI